MKTFTQDELRAASGRPPLRGSTASIGVSARQATSTGWWLFWHGLHALLRRSGFVIEARFEGDREYVRAGGSVVPKTPKWWYVLAAATIFLFGAWCALAFLAVVMP